MTAQERIAAEELVASNGKFCGNLKCDDCPFEEECIGTGLDDLVETARKALLDTTRYGRGAC